MTVSIDTISRANVADLFAQTRHEKRAPKLRTMREFAEQEIVLPDGPYENLPFRCDRQPLTRLWFDAVDSGIWWWHVITGPVQDGKSLIGFVIPFMYHAFERREKVICGLPSMDLAESKWTNDFLPAIEASRYRNLLPRSGAGSRGGTPKEIRFGNGGQLKFMSAGGKDKKRSSYTAPVIVLTEVDGMDTAASTSRETDPVSQIIQRCESYISHGLARVYEECTVSITKGRINQDYLAGTASRIAIPCPHCKLRVTPEREDFTGWQDAEDALDAADLAHFACPECREPWTEKQRVTANRSPVIVHDGQEITPEGQIVGTPKRTEIFGFRWNRANSIIKNLRSVASQEWAAARAVDEGAKEKALMQGAWVVPVEADELEVVPLSIKAISERQGTTPMGMVPAWCDIVALGIDVGQYLLHWSLLGADSARKRHIQAIDYGVIEVHSRQFKIEDALTMALTELLGRAFDQDQGWMNENGEIVHPDLAWVDAGWKPVPIYQFCRGAGPQWSPVKGFGLFQYAGQHYRQPKTTGTNCIAIYDGFHLAKIKHNEVGIVQLYEFDADRAKARVHDRLGVPEDEPGAMLLPQVERAVEHTSFVKHLLAEQLIEGDDGIQRWQKTPGHGGHNHWLDGTGIALMAIHRRLQARKSPPKRKARPVITTPDGRPFVASQR